MYKHDIHKGFTYLFFFMITIVILIPTVPISFHIDQYTYMNALIFSIIGSVCFSEIYLALHESIKDRGFLASFVRYLFILPVFAINSSIVLLGNWFALQYKIVDTLNFTWFTVVGGLIWLISFHTAKLVPNLPAMVFKKKEQ